MWLKNCFQTFYKKMPKLYNNIFFISIWIMFLRPESTSMKAHGTFYIGMLKLSETTMEFEQISLGVEKTTKALP